MGISGETCNSDIGCKCPSKPSSLDLRRGIEKLALHNKTVYGILYLQHKGMFDYTTALELMVLQLAEEQREIIKQWIEAECSSRTVYVLSPDGSR